MLCLHLLSLVCLMEGLIGLQVDPGSEDTNPIGNRIETSLNFRGQKTVKIGKTTYKCKLNINYHLSPSKCTRSSAKCNPMPRKPIKIKVKTDDATIGLTVAKNKVKVCTVVPSKEPMLFNGFTLPHIFTSNTTIRVTGGTLPASVSFVAIGGGGGENAQSGGSSGFLAMGEVIIEGDFDVIIGKGGKSGQDGGDTIIKDNEVVAKGGKHGGYLRLFGSCREVTNNTKPGGWSGGGGYGSRYGGNGGSAGSDGQPGCGASICQSDIWWCYGDKGTGQSLPANGLVVAGSGGSNGGKKGGGGGGIILGSRGVGSGYGAGGGGYSFTGRDGAVILTSSEPISVTPTDPITELKEKFMELEASFEKLKASLHSKCDADTCSNIQIATSKIETCLGDVSSKDCPLSPNGKTGLAAALDEKCDKSTCNPPHSVLWMGSDPWTTLSIPDFSTAPPNCTIPDADFHKEPGQIWGQVYYGQEINGVMYVCGKDKCQSYKSQNKKWETEDDMKLSRSRAGSTLIPGTNPKWIVHGGDRHGRQDPTQEVWTPETRKWEVDPDYRSPLPVYGHCIVAMEGKTMQIGGVNDGGGHYQKRVFLGEDEVASMKVEHVYHTCILFQNLVWVAGGGGWFSEPGLVEVYNHTANSWTDGPTLPLEKHDNYPKLLEIQGSLYYIGGYDAGKIFKLENNDWIDVASIPKTTKLVAAVLEIEC